MKLSFTAVVHFLIYSHPFFLLLESHCCKPDMYWIFRIVNVTFFVFWVIYMASQLFDK